MWATRLTKYDAQKRRIRQFIKQEMEISFSHKAGLEAFDYIFNPTNNTGKRRILFVILSVCFTICCYQTYDRLQFYISGPYKVDVEFAPPGQFPLPHFMLAGLDTPALSEYWKQAPLREYNYAKLVKDCTYPVQGIINREVNVKDYSHLWSQSNLTSNLLYIKLKRNKETVQELSLENGNILKRKGEPFKIFYKNYTRGQALIIPPDMNIDTSGLKLSVLAIKNGSCGYAALTIALLDDSLRQVNILTLRSGVSIDMGYHMRKYSFLSSRPPYCEPDEVKQTKCWENCFPKNINFRCKLPFRPGLNNEPDCSVEPNKTLVAKTYQQLVNALKTTSATLHCGCLRPCNNYFYSPLFRIHTDLNNNSLSKVELQNVGHSVTAMTESYIYGIADLLIDFGGNFGFSLGFSLLTIFEIVQLIIHIAYSHLKPVHLTKYIKKKIINQINLIEKPTKGSRQNKLVLLLYVANSTLVCYMAIEKINVYLSEPTRYVVNVEEKNIMHLPDVIICAEGQLITNYKVEYAKITRNELCKVSLLDLMNLKNENKYFSANELWKYQTPFLDYNKMRKIEAVGMGILVKWHEINMHTGVCLVSEIGEQQFSVIRRNYFSSVIVSNTTCDTDIYEIFIQNGPSDIATTLKSRRRIVSRLYAGLLIKTTSKLRLNLRSSPCFKAEEYKKCHNDCNQRKIFNFIHCKLPFMDKVEKNDCINSEEAKISFGTFLNKSLQIDPHKDCGCHLPCEKKLYETTVVFMHPDAVPIGGLGILVASNVEEEFVQTLAYPIVALFCDIGNIFSLMLGLSVLAIPQILMTNDYIKGVKDRLFK